VTRQVTGNRSRGSIFQ